MRAAEAWEIARRRLGAALGRDLAEAVAFVADEDVSYGQERGIIVLRSSLFGLDSDRWVWLLGDRPSWIHFNLLEAGIEPAVVTVRRSPASIAPDDPHSTTINVSVESKPVVVDPG